MSKKYTSRIKLDKLKSEIQIELDNYHESLVKAGSTKSIDFSVGEWFDKEFENWFLSRFKENNNSRNNIRVDVEIPVSVVETLIENDDDIQDSEIDMIGTIVNISKGGFFFKSSRPYPQSSIIKVNIDFSKIDDLLKDIEALAMVVRCERNSDNSYGIGVMFSSIYDESKDNLTLFIIEKLSNYIYNE